VQVHADLPCGVTLRRFIKEERTVYIAVNHGPERVTVEIDGCRHAIDAQTFAHI